MARTTDARDSGTAGVDRSNGGPWNFRTSLRGCGERGARDRAWSRRRTIRQALSERTRRHYRPRTPSLRPRRRAIRHQHLQRCQLPRRQHKFSPTKARGYLLSARQYAIARHRCTMAQPKRGIRGRGRGRGKRNAGSCLPTSPDRLPRGGPWLYDDLPPHDMIAARVAENADGVAINDVAYIRCQTVATSRSNRRDANCCTLAPSSR